MNSTRTRSGRLLVKTIENELQKPDIDEWCRLYYCQLLAAINGVAHLAIEPPRPTRVKRRVRQALCGVKAERDLNKALNPEKNREKALRAADRLLKSSGRAAVFDEPSSESDFKIMEPQEVSND